MENHRSLKYGAYILRGKSAHNDGDNDDDADADADPEVRVSNSGSFQIILYLTIVQTSRVDIEAGGLVSHCPGHHASGTYVVLMGNPPQPHFLHKPAGINWAAISTQSHSHSVLDLDLCHFSTER